MSNGHAADLILRVYEEIYNQHDFDLVDKYYMTDLINHHPGAKPGVEGLKEWLSGMFGFFPDAVVTIDHLVSQNNRAMVFLTWRGHLVDSDQELLLNTANLYRVQDGKIAEHWSVVNYSGLTKFGLPAPDQEQPASEPDWNASETERDNLKLVLTVWDEIMTQHRLDLADRYFTQDYIQHNRFAAESGAGIQGFRDFFGGLFAAAPDLSGTITQIVADGDRVGLFATWRGTEAETGRKLKLNTADLVRIENGKIAEHWDVFDYSAVAQFGITPPAP
ncbi:MAG: ester cyclase [Actinomadura rubrobrunea]|nr:ester cyclase [Actinomadura rubrobrunea]